MSSVQAIAQQLRVAIRGELPVVSMLRDGAMAFVQLGESHLQRSWVSSVQGIGGRDVDVPSIIRAMATAEREAVGGNFSVPSEADLAAGAVPSHFSYEAVSRFPLLDTNASLQAALCVFWPDSFPLPLQRQLNASRSSNASYQFDEFSDYPETLLGYPAASLLDLEAWAN